MISSFENDLRNQTEAEIHFDTIHRQAYSVDASIFEIQPLGVAIPKTKNDLVTILRLAKQYNIPVIARGAATGITGGCIGKGLIIDLSKYLNRILEINYDQEYAICEPGVVQDQLNLGLAERGYRLGPDTSTGNRATLGGMVGNNAAGARSLRYGKMVDHVISVELALASGTLVTFSAIDADSISRKMALENEEGTIYRKIIHIQEHYRNEIEEHFPKIPRRVSGYNLDELIAPGPLNLSKLIVGSEGTLGITTEIKVKICKKPGILGLCVIHFHELNEGMNAIPTMLSFAPLSLEMIDNKIIEMGRQSPSMKGKLTWLKDQPRMVFVAEFDAHTPEELQKKIHQFESEIARQNIGYARVTILDPTQMNYVWEIRKAGLGLLLSKRTYSRAIAFIEDITLSPEQLAPFMTQFEAYLKKVGKEAGIYGHVGSGCMHVRPYIDLRQPEELDLMKTMMQDIADLLLKYGGALSGEHGDGIIRSWLNPKMFGEKLYQAFLEVKAAFDPENRMNPGKIVNGQPLLENLRLDPTVKPRKIQTFLNFEREGGFELAVDLCNGNGLCRKSEKVMCPSFQASKDEYDTTRARAQALRGIINRQLPAEAMSHQDVYDVLDLCLECKGCKTECPSQVDMAKMKSEFLYHYYQKHHHPLRNYLFGYIGTLNWVGSKFPKIFNFFVRLKLTKAILSWLGIAPERPLPGLAESRFSKLHETPQASSNQSKVVLFNDTFTEFNHPEIGTAALKVLKALGVEVIIPPWTCCGRPLLSKGLLSQAKEKAAAVIAMLYPYAQKGIKIIGLEPSCILTIKDDYPNFFNDEPTQAVIRACTTFDEFLNDQLQEGKLPLKFTETEQEVKIHGHCYQKSLVGMQPSLNVLNAIPGFTVSEIPSGCCGVAGSFGYEKEHYAFSIKIGELQLFPTIRKAAEKTLIVANGMSCRSQISHGTGKRALHLAEVIAMHLSS